MASTTMERSHVVMRCLSLILLLPIASSYAQESAQTLERVVVTATRTERSQLDVPASTDVVDRDEVRDTNLRVNLSESLVRVPGLVVLNRQNYAQDSADLGARLRCALDVRRARCSPLRRRHTRNDARRARTGVALRIECCRSNRGASRSVFCVVRQLVGRRDSDDDSPRARPN